MRQRQTKKRCIQSCLFGIDMTEQWESSIPSSNDSILGSETVNGSILHAESNNSFTFTILHQQIQGKVLHKVTGVITKRLSRKHKNRIICEMQFNKVFFFNLCIRLIKFNQKMKERECVFLPGHKVCAIASVLSCLLHSSNGEPGLPFHTWDSDLQRLSGRSSRLQYGWMACQNSPAKTQRATWALYLLLLCVNKLKWQTRLHIPTFYLTPSYIINTNKITWYKCQKRDILLFCLILIPKCAHLFFS